MTKKRTFICLPLTDIESRSPLIVEHLRYMGVVHVSDTTVEQPRRWLSVECPQGVNGKIWAEQNLARLGSFQRHAVSYEGYGWQDIPVGMLNMILATANADPAYTRDFAAAIGEM